MYAPCNGQHEKHGTKHVAWLFSIASKLRVRCVNERFCCVSGLSRSADRSATCGWSASCMHAERPASKSSWKTHWMPVPRRWRPDTRPSAVLKHPPSLPCLGLFSSGFRWMSVMPGPAFLDSGLVLPTEASRVRDYDILSMAGSPSAIEPGNVANPKSVSGARSASASLGLSCWRPVLRPAEGDGLAMSLSCVGFCWTLLPGAGKQSHRSNKPGHS